MGSVAGMGVGGGFGGRMFLPDDLLAGATGLYADLDAEGAVTRNTQPDTSGGWAGASWAGSGLGPYTHTPGDATALAAAIIIVGNRYLTRFTVSDRTAGSVTFYAGTTAGTARSTNATFTEELTCAGTTSHNFVPSADFDGKVTVDSVVVVANLSVSQITCKGNLGNLVQATAANMPWDSDASAQTSVLVNGRRVLYFDGVADYVASGVISLAEWTVAFVCKATAATALAQYAVSLGGTTGITYGGAAVPQKVTLFDGTDVLSSTADIVVGTPGIVVCSNDGTTQRLRFNGAETTSNDCALTATALRVGMRSDGTNPFPGWVTGVLLVNRALTTAECLNLEAWYRTRYAL